MDDRLDVGRGDRLEPLASIHAGPGAQASSETTQARQPAYQTAYGISSDGLTTDLYTELFRGKRTR